MKSKLLLALVLTLTVLGCQGKNRGKTTAVATGMLHNAAQCPQLTEGYYNADNAKEKFIEIYHNREEKRMEVNFQGNELVAMNGKEATQRNGVKTTGSCISGNLRIVARDEKGGLVTTVIKRDGTGLSVEQTQPKVAAVHYTMAGALRTSVDKFKEMLVTDKTKEKTTGIPREGKPLAPETKPSTAPQTSPTPPAPTPVPAPTPEAPKSEPAPASAPVQQQAPVQAPK